MAASPLRQVLAHINVTAAETRVNVSLQLPPRGGDFYLAVVATSHSGLRAPSPLFRYAHSWTATRLRRPS